MFFLKEIIYFFSKYALNWSNLIVKTFTMLQMTFISNKCCSFKSLKGHVTLKSQVMAAENAALITWIYYK